MRRGNKRVHRTTLVDEEVWDLNVKILGNFHVFSCCVVRVVKGKYGPVWWEGQNAGPWAVHQSSEVS